MKTASFSKHILVVFVICFAQAAMAFDSASRAIGNEPRIWRALSGDTLELDGTAYRLHAVQCPAVTLEEGRKAKALLNTFLRGGEITCRVWHTPQGPQARCAKEGRDIATGMLRSGLCQPAPDGTLREAQAEDILRLSAASRDRRQFLDNLCQPRSLGTEPGSRFLNRCPNEVLQRAIETYVENQLSANDTE